jgi:glutamine---fructose-6-phosphate transaminase (isomerizing)
MCGVFGYTGNNIALDIIYRGLKKLEYRGYDSSGIFVNDSKEFSNFKTTEKLHNLRPKIYKQFLNEYVSNSTVGIGHTRWATHGKPTLYNAHPHISDNITIVHNGVVENYYELKNQLLESGTKFKSDTDTEVILEFINKFVNEGLDVRKSIEKTTELIIGSYAFIILEKKTNKLFGTKRGLPLLLGVKNSAVIDSDVSVGDNCIIGGQEYFISSDTIALTQFTKDLITLEDNDILELTKKGFKITNFGKKKNRKLVTFDLTVENFDKNGHEHFMFKEILEQPHALRNTINNCIDFDNGKILHDKIYMPYSLDFRRVLIIACGTSYHAGLVAKCWIEKFANLPVDVQFASEISSKEAYISKFDLVLAVTQSGETYDTLQSVKLAKKAGARVFTITNVKDSAITKISDYVFYTKCGFEIGVASTKCFTSQLGALLLLSIYLSTARNMLNKEKRKEVLNNLRKIPDYMENYLTNNLEKIKRIAKKYYRTKSMLFLGKGYNFPIALEAALKLKEISYIYAEGYASGEMKHGPIALIDKKMPTVVIAPNDNNNKKIMSNAQEINAREGKIILLTPESSNELANHTISIPDHIEDYLLPFITILPLQLLSYYIALFKGNDIDQPRNLAKTVTVE